MMSTFPHAKRRNTLKAVLIWALMMIPASGVAYSISSHVRELEKEQASLKQAIAQEQESLRVLHAEWAYLNNPQRLASRAKNYLGFKTNTSSKQIASLPDMGYKLAYRGEQLSIAQAAAAMPAAGQVASTQQQPLSTKVLAKPIAYSPQLVDALGPDRNVKLPSSVNWQEKVVSAFNVSDGSPDAGRSRGHTIP